MKLSELVAECRRRAPQDESWSIEVKFWHHDNSRALGRPSSSEEMGWVIFRHNPTCQIFTGPTPEAVLALAFPPDVPMAEQVALVDEPTDPDAQHAAEQDAAAQAQALQAEAHTWPR